MLKFVVVEGIALGRQEGLAEGLAMAEEGVELAEEAIARLKDANQGYNSFSLLLR